MAEATITSRAGLEALLQEPGPDAQTRKQGVRRNFARRAKTYDRHAAVQRLMGRELLARHAGAVTAARRLLEIGCGTGYLTAGLRRLNPRALLVAVDLDRTLLEAARHRLGPHPGNLWVIADGETIRRGGFDLVIANASFQWLVDPRQALENYFSSLAPGGRLAFSSLGPGTFRELAAALSLACRRLSCHYPPIPAAGFLGAEDWQLLLDQAGFRQSAVECRSLTLSYPGVREFLLTLRATGATNPRPRPFSPRLLTALSQAYQELSGSAGAIPATYDLIWAAAAK